MQEKIIWSGYQIKNYYLQQQLFIIFYYFSYIGIIIKAKNNR